jgi:hypothetical protein
MVDKDNRSEVEKAKDDLSRQLGGIQYGASHLDTTTAIESLIRAIIREELAKPDNPLCRIFGEPAQHIINESKGGK